MIIDLCMSRIPAVPVKFAVGKQLTIPWEFGYHFLSTTSLLTLRTLVKIFVLFWQHFVNCLSVTCTWRSHIRPTYCKFCALCIVWPTFYKIQIYFKRYNKIVQKLGDNDQNTTRLMQVHLHWIQYKMFRVIIFMRHSVFIAFWVLASFTVN